jgi:hypothetical protein
MRGCAQKWRSIMSMIGWRSSSGQKVHLSGLSSSMAVWSDILSLVMLAGILMMSFDVPGELEEEVGGSVMGSEFGL